MRIIIFIFILFFCAATSHAQNEFWGTTENGGTGNGGVIFKLNTDGSGYEAKYNFPAINPGQGPKYAPAIVNGNYYGTTEYGGKFAAGVLYEYNTSTGIYTVLHDFKTEQGKRPLGNVVSVNGKLYGTTYDYNGGSSKPGVIWEFDLTANVYTVKKIFSNYTGSVLGSRPAGALAVYNGKIYGSTTDGGSGLAGSIYEYDPATDIFTSLYGFAYIGGGYPNGKLPNGSLILYNGNLYGTTQSGGANSTGVLFKFDLSSHTFSKLFDFGAIGMPSNPVDGLIVMNNIFYGVTPGGGANSRGTLFSFSPVANVVTNLYDFKNTGPTGVSPQFKLTTYNNLLYGSSVNNANYDANIFSYDPLTNTITSEFSAGNTGEGINGEFLIDGDKFITVTTAYVNSIISYDPATKIKTTLKKLNTYANGAIPNRNLLYANGVFYSSTNKGGTNDLGVVYSFNPVTSDFNVLFNLTTNAYNLGDLSLVGNVLYAPANDGYYQGIKTQDFGAVFYLDLTTNAGSYTSISPFASFGTSPRGVMIPGDNPEELLVTTSYGGPTGGGTITKFNTSTKLFEGGYTSYFGSNTVPQYTSRTSDGKVYVTTQNAGTSSQGSLHQQYVGTVTSFNATTTGRGPDGVIAELNGKYYLTTRYDGLGASTRGTIVEIDPANMATPILKSKLTNLTGNTHAGNLQVLSGKLYGVMSSGGKTEVNSTGDISNVNRGVVFSYDPVADVYTKLHEFNGFEGERPACLVIAPTGVLPLKFISFTAQKCQGNAVCLNWETENEINVSHFDILRSIDGRIFTKIAEEKSKNNAANKYVYADDTKAVSAYSKVYYRIKQVDTDGQSTLTEIRSVSIEPQINVIVYPNPVSDILHCSNEEMIKEVRIMNVHGTVIKTISKGFSNISIMDLSAGTYIASILLKRGEVIQQKVVKL